MSEHPENNELARRRCTACRGDDPPLSTSEIESLRPQIPSWTLEKGSEDTRLERVFLFRNFLAAMEFSADIGRVAEEQGHHPKITTEWGRVTVTWWTHKIHGLHVNDFIMASRTDDIYAGWPEQQKGKKHNHG